MGNCGYLTSSHATHASHQWLAERSRARVLLVPTTRLCVPSLSCLSVLELSWVYGTKICGIWTRLGLHLEYVPTTKYLPARQRRKLIPNLQRIASGCLLLSAAQPRHQASMLSHIQGQASPIYVVSSCWYTRLAIYYLKEWMDIKLN